jgi:hypothetical protein
MKEWKDLVHFRYVFFYEHIYIYIYIYTHTHIHTQEKINIMKNKILMKEGKMQVPS